MHILVGNDGTRLGVRGRVFFLFNGYRVSFLNFEGRLESVQKGLFHDALLLVLWRLMKSVAKLG
jgi:hypothetical protein